MVGIAPGVAFLVCSTRDQCAGDDADGECDAPEEPAQAPERVVGRHGWLLRGHEHNQYRIPLDCLRRDLRHCRRRVPVSLRARGDSAFSGHIGRSRNGCDVVERRRDPLGPGRSLVRGRRPPGASGTSWSSAHVALPTSGAARSAPAAPRRSARCSTSSTSCTRTSRASTSTRSPASTPRRRTPRRTTSRRSPATAPPTSRTCSSSSSSSGSRSTTPTRTHCSPRRSSRRTRTSCASRARRSRTSAARRRSRR